MTTITTSEIKNQLVGRFNNVTNLSRIEPSNIFDSSHARTVSVLSYKGLDLMVGCYALTEDIEEGEYQRYLWIPQTKTAFAF